MRKTFKGVVKRTRTKNKYHLRAGVELRGGTLRLSKFCLLVYTKQLKTNLEKLKVWSFRHYTFKIKVHSLTNSFSLKRKLTSHQLKAKNGCLLWERVDHSTSKIESESAGGVDTQQLQCVLISTSFGARNQLKLSKSLSGCWGFAPARAVAGVRVYGCVSGSADQNVRHLNLVRLVFLQLQYTINENR